MDLIVASGDLAVLNPELNGNAAEVQKAEADLTQVLQHLEGLRDILLHSSPDAALPIYWLPGNVRVSSHLSVFLVQWSVSVCVLSVLSVCAECVCLSLFSVGLCVCVCVF